MTPLSERDRKTIEKSNQRSANIKIVKGLMSKGYSETKIADMMGVPGSYVRAIVRRYIK